MTAEEEHLQLPNENEEREKEISEKIARIRAQNVQWQQRYLEIELDRNQAETSGMAVNRHQNRYIYKSPSDSKGHPGRGKNNKKPRFLSHNRPGSDFSQDGDSRPSSQGQEHLPVSNNYKEGKSPRYNHSKKHHDQEGRRDYPNNHHQYNNGYKQNNYQHRYNGDNPVRLRRGGGGNRTNYGNRHTWYGDQFNETSYSNYNTDNHHYEKFNGDKYSEEKANLNDSNATVGIVRPKTRRRGGAKRGQPNRKSWCDPNDLANHQDNSKPQNSDETNEQTQDKKERRKTWYCENREFDEEEDETLTIGPVFVGSGRFAACDNRTSGSQSFLSSCPTSPPAPSANNDPTVSASQTSEASVDSKITSTPIVTSSNSIELSNTPDTTSSMRINAASEATQHNNAAPNQKSGVPSNLKNKQPPREGYRRSDVENWRQKTQHSWRESPSYDSYNSFNGPPRGRGFPRGRGWTGPRGRGRGNGQRQFHTRSSSLSLENLSRLSSCSDGSGHHRANRHRGGRGNAPIYRPPHRRTGNQPSQEHRHDDKTSVPNHPRNPLDEIDDDPKSSELDDEYIDDTLEDIDQYRLKIDLIDFIVDNPVHPDPILSRPLTSWHSQIFADHDSYERHSSLMSGNFCEQNDNFLKQTIGCKTKCDRTEESDDCGYRSNEHMDESQSPEEFPTKLLSEDKVSSLSKRTNSYLTLVWDESTGNAPFPNENPLNQST